MLLERKMAVSSYLNIDIVLYKAEVHNGGGSIPSRGNNVLVPKEVDIIVPSWVLNLHGIIGNKKGLMFL